MNTKRKPQPIPVTPDLLTPVVEKMKTMTPKEIDALAVACNASSVTIKNIRDGKVGPLGPSHYLVLRLYDRLVTNAAAATKQ